MKLVSVFEVLQGNIILNSQVILRGWIRTRRDSKLGISFLHIYDGSCLGSLQVIIHNTLPNYKEEVLHLTTGCSVSIVGKIVQSPSSGQSFELVGNNLTVLGWIEDPNTYPISAKRHNLSYLREVAHLRPRTHTIGAVTRIRHTLAWAIHQFMHQRGFFWVSTPVITAADTEGVGHMFRVSTLDLENLPRKKNGKIDFKEDFFGKEAFLTVSGQLNGEAYACAVSRVYTFGPTFRAENSHTKRHLSEFWMVEPEVAFANLDDIAELAECMLKDIFKVILEERYDDIEFLSQRSMSKNLINQLEQCILSKFIRIDYNEVSDILRYAHVKFEKNFYWGQELSSEHEKYLLEKYFPSPIIIKNYPKEIKAFYMRVNEDDKTVSALDILFPGIGEIIGGSQREERLEKLDKRLDALGMNKENYWWYRDLRKYGTVPHSGFGLGFDRLVSYVTGLNNIRDVIPFPRTPGNISF
ncbi:asparagine--tRNA ligase [Candidatus Schneideria nysicola]|uniref:asparagine--tRNA ligase n=1 Tax=Candidatus Schneideria nysicola TaxID=1081631 RepID=UPI001CAA5DB7|nr:asparagine--tRNA ligase [Candidatus Schneideria nysicola]UAJ66153.1 asparagine--tRNA ligase [Candidatus Schneideria nysicola]